MTSLSGLRQAIDQALLSFLAAQRERMAVLAADSAALVDLVSAAAATGGKRIRPILCWCAYQAGGGAGAGGPAAAGPGPILAAAASLELLHTFAILHDDVMDQAVLRRGKPALHRRLAAERRAAGGGEDADAYGVSVAVLAGDLALVLSDAMFAASGFPPETLDRAEPALEAMRVSAVAGQYLDILEAGAAGAPDAPLIGHLKTASYSVEGPVGVGIALAGAPEPVARALQGYAVAVGEAFYRADELLGLFGDPAATGKDAESDLRRGKPTALIADALARGVVLPRWGDPHATAADLDAVRQAVAASGALEASRSTVNEHVDRALGCLGSAGLLGTGAGGLLAELAERIRP